jgi:AraC-like DNA-binding protein
VNAPNKREAASTTEHNRDNLMAPLTAHYVELVCDRMRADHINVKDLSAKAGMSRQTLSRKLKTHEFGFDEIKRLFAALNIDGQCAMLAIENEGDWRMYDSNTLEVAATLAKLLPGKIAAALERDIQPLRHGAIHQLAREVAARIVQHDNDVLKRRETL